jgi:hypothetical protein
VFVANAFRQDWPVLGHTTQATVIYNRNREGNQGTYYDRNGFKVRPAVIGDVRPHNYDVVYAGLSGDGHFGRWNLSTSAYLALGRADLRPDRTAQPAHPRAGFAAAELSRDFDWLRVRATGADRQCRQRPVRWPLDRFRRDPREPADCRRRHQLLDPPVNSADRRRRTGVVRAQWRAAHPCGHRRSRANRTSSIPA